MKTIEERAWEKYPEVIKHHNLAHIDINEEKRKTYIEIATEQKAIDDAETMLEKLDEFLSTASQEDLDVKYNGLSEFLSIEPATTVYDEASYEQGYHDAIGKAAEVFSEMLVELWPGLLSHGGIAKKWENEFRKRLEE